MPRESSSPQDLADIVLSELRLRRLRRPTKTEILQICERLFFASLKTEEMHHATISVTYVDPANLDPKPPPVIHRDQWAFVPFADSLPFDIRTLVKLSLACDPRSSSFAVHPDQGGNLRIWGLIDQQNSQHDWINHESDRAQRPAGLFRAMVVGLGHIKVYIGYENIAELKAETLISRRPDVFRRGPAFDRLCVGINAHIESVRESHTQQIEVYVPRLANDWIAVICRLLLRVQAYQHGGAILLTPDRNFEHLNVKHRLDYQRLRKSLVALNVHGRQAYEAQDMIWSKHVDTRPEMPTELHLKAAVEEEESESARSELNGAIWFVSLLTRVDGLVLMDPLPECLRFRNRDTSAN